MRRPRVKTVPWRMRAAWTGITAPDCHLCTWAVRNGIREVKYRSSACLVHPAPVTDGSAPDGGGGR